MSTPATRTLAPRGTYGAYQRHVRRGEPVDDACRGANTAYQQGHRKRSEKRRAQEAAYSRARRAALERLRRAYPDVFQRLLDEELTKAGVV